MDMTALDHLPSAFDGERLLALADGHHARTAGPLGAGKASGHPGKAERLTAWGRDVVEGAPR